MNMFILKLKQLLGALAFIQIIFFNLCKPRQKDQAKTCKFHLIFVDPSLQYEF